MKPLDPPPPPPILNSALYRWGMLALVVALLAFSLLSASQSSSEPKLEAYSSLAVPLMLLFNHLASAFTWRKSISRVLHALAGIWVIVGIIWIAWDANQSSAHRQEQQGSNAMITPVYQRGHG